MVYGDPSCPGWVEELDAVRTSKHTQIKALPRKEKKKKIKKVISPLLAVYQVSVQGGRAALIVWVCPAGWAIAHPISLL